MSKARLRTIAIVLAAAWMTSSSLAQSISPTPEEMAKARQWATKFDRAVAAKDAEPPFSFVYDSKPSAQLLAQWSPRQTLRRIDDQRTQRTTTWTDRKTGLEVTLRFGRVLRFSRRRVDGLLQEHGQIRHADFGRRAGHERLLPPRRRRRLYPAQHARRRLLGRQLSAARRHDRQRDKPSVCSGWRAADPRNNDAVFQRGMARPRRNRRAGLAGAMGGRSSPATNPRC